MIYVHPNDRHDSTEIHFFSGGEVEIYGAFEGTVPRVKEQVQGIAPVPFPAPALQAPVLQVSTSVAPEQSQS